MLAVASTGSFVLGQCAPDVLSANQAMCSRAYPFILSDGSTVSCSSYSATGLVLQKRVYGTTVALQSNSVFNYPSCDPAANYADVSNMWGLFILAGAAIYALRSFVLRLVSNQ